MARALGGRAAERVDTAAARRGVMGVYALVYAFPNVDKLGSFWLVFATGTAVAAWINFGSPRISYGGYQTGLAFYKATLQNLGPAASATVVRDRLIGVAFGLIVFGLVEHVLWPVRAADRMYSRLADVFRSLAAFARVASRPLDDRGDEEARRPLIPERATGDVSGAGGGGICAGAGGLYGALAVAGNRLAPSGGGSIPPAAPAIAAGFSR